MFASQSLQLPSSARQSLGACVAGVAGGMVDAGSMMLVVDGSTAPLQVVVVDGVVVDEVGMQDPQSAGQHACIGALEMGLWHVSNNRLLQ